MKHMISLLSLSLILAGSAWASETTVQKEEALDDKLGLIVKPFVINLVALQTRTKLQAAAKIKTGLPSYDQQVETAQAAPARLFEQLTMPNPVATQRRTRPRASAQEGATSSSKQPKCYFNHNQQKICE